MYRKFSLRLICFCVVFTVLLQMFTVSVSFAEEAIIYKASDTLSVWNANTSPWQYHAKMRETGDWVLMSVGATVGNLDSSTTYKVIRKDVNVTFGFGHNGWSLIVGSGDGAADPNAGNVNAFVNATQISVGSYSNAVTISKTFTAPKSGKIKISMADGTIQSYCGQRDYGPVFSILSSTGKTVYGPLELKGSSSTSNAAVSYDFEPMYITVTEGEKLYFTANDPAGKIDRWRCYVVMEPVVEYITDEEYEKLEFLKTASYKASDYFDISVAEKGPWSCQYYMPGTGYKNMPYMCSWVAGFDDAMSGQGKAWVQNDDKSHPELSVAVGKYLLRPGVDIAGTYEPLLTSKAVRTFTAPHTGRISVKADDGNGSSRIVAPKLDSASSGTEQGAFVRIMYNGRMVWPNDTSNMDGVQIGADGYVNADEFFLDVKKGDKIHFEVHNGSIYYNYWRKHTYWDPVVKYVKAESYADGMYVTDAEGNELPDIEAMIAEGQCNINVTVNAVYENLGDLTVIAAAYDENGRLVTSGYDSHSVAMDDSVNYSIYLEGLTEEAECIKTFAFKDFNSLKPIKIEGLGGVLVKKDSSWMPAFENVSGKFVFPYTGTVLLGNNEMDVIAGQEIEISEETIISYIDVKEESIQLTPEMTEYDGYVLVDALNFFGKLGVNLKNENGHYKGKFNDAPVDIPINEDVAYYDSVNIELDCNTVFEDGRLYVDSSFFEKLYGVTKTGETFNVEIYRPQRIIDYEKILDTPTGGESIIDGNKIYDIALSKANAYNIGVSVPEDGRFEKVLKLETYSEPVTTYSYRTGPITNHTAYSFGDVLVLSFWARATYISDDTGRAYVGVTLEDPTWRKDVSSDVLVNTEWKKYYIPFEAGKNISPGGIALQFHCGYKPQTVEIADVEIINYKKSVKISELTNIEKKSTYKGREEDALWRKEALKRIEKYRTQQTVVKIVDENGDAVQGADVSMKMKKSAFMFGTETSGDTYNIVKNSIIENFNAITTSYMKLGMFSRKNIQRAIDLAKENDLYIRAHALIYDHPIFMWKSDSEECQRWNMYENPYAYTEQEATEMFNQYIDARLEEYPGFDHWDVLNEPVSVYTYRSRFGNDFAANWVKRFKEQAGNSKAYINQCGIDGQTSGYRMAELFSNVVKSMQDYGAEIDGVGIQGHIRELIYPQDFYNQLDKAAEFVDELTVTEYDADLFQKNNSVRYEDVWQLEADMLRDLLIATYSHPKAKGFFAWGICDRVQSASSGLLLDRDFNAKPSMTVWQDLVLNQWKTEENGISDNNGEFTFKGHLGDYILSVDGIEIECTVAKNDGVLELVAVYTGDSLRLKSEKYVASDTLNVWNSNTSPWQYSAKVEGGDWKLMKDGNSIGYVGDDEYKVIRKEINRTYGFGHNGWSLVVSKGDGATIPDNGNIDAFINTKQLSVGSYNQNTRIAKSFVAPKSGRIKITMDGDVIKSYCGKKLTGPYVGIESSLNGRIYESPELKGELTATDSVLTCIFEPIYITVEKGEKLYFEGYDPNGRISQWNCFVDFNPVIEYMGYIRDWSC